MTSNPQKRKPKHKRGRKKTKKIKDAESPVNSPPPESSGSSEHGNEDGLLAERDTEEEATSGSSEEEAAGYRMLSEAEKEGSEGMQEEKEDEEGYSGSSEEHDDGQESSDRENDGQQRSNRFAEGSNAFRSAFSKIMGKKVSDDSSGPVLSAHKKLVAKKLDEEAGEPKVKNEAKKEKRLVLQQIKNRENEGMDRLALAEALSLAERQTLHECGLGRAVHSRQMIMDQSLLIELLSTWDPTTHAFYLPGIGATQITPRDVRRITGLADSGDEVVLYSRVRGAEGLATIYKYFTGEAGEPQRRGLQSRIYWEDAHHCYDR